MKTKWHLCLLWSVLSLGLLGCASDTYESPTSALKRTKTFKLGAPKSKRSTTGEGKSSEELSADTSPLPPLAPQTTPGKPRSARQGKSQIKSDFAYLPDVSVTCSTSNFVVRVKPAFYGLGAVASELKLGSTCRSNGVLRPYGDLLFTYPLTGCDSQRELPRGYLVYKFVLHYEPSPKRYPSRAHRVDVEIECRYQRNHHVYQLAVQPTWETTVVRKSLKGRQNDFQIKIMDDSWSRPAKSQVYQLGKMINFQVSAPKLPTGGKLYIRSCYAAPASGGHKSSLRYTIIDNFGCMLDSKREPGASQFVSRTDKTLRFSMEAFQFISNPDAKVVLHFKLFATSEEPGPAHKSCTYRRNRWEALAGHDSICECCDSRCVTSKPRRAMMEGSASSGPLLVSDMPHTSNNIFSPASPSMDSMRSGNKTTTSHENLWENADVFNYDDDEEEELDDDDEEEGPRKGRERPNLGVMTEPGLGKVVFRERVLVEERKESEEKGSSGLVEDGSGYEEDSLESGEEDVVEGEEDEQLFHPSDPKDGEVLRNWAQLEQMLPLHGGLWRKVDPLTSGEEEHRKYTGRNEEAESVKISELERRDDDYDYDDFADVDNRLLTWYFKWR